MEERIRALEREVAHLKQRLKTVEEEKEVLLEDNRELRRCHGALLRDVLELETEAA